MSHPWEVELPALADKSDQEAADAINSIRETVRREPTKLAVLNYGTKATNAFAILSIARHDLEAIPAASRTTKQAVLLGSLYTLFGVLENPAYTTFDVDCAAVQSGLAMLVAAGIGFTAEMAAGITALAAVPNQPKYETVTAGQVAEARESN